MSDLQLDDSGRLTMANARFLGTDDKGQPYTLTTREAWQDPDEKDIVNLEDVEGDMLLDSGAWFAISSVTGRYDQSTQILTLQEDVSLYTDQGYELHTEKAEFDLEAGNGLERWPVSGQGPSGLVDAQGFRITLDDGKLHLVGPVHMTLFPGPTP